MGLPSECVGVYYMIIASGRHVHDLEGGEDGHIMRASPHDGTAHGVGPGKLGRRQRLPVQVHLHRKKRGGMIINSKSTSYRCDSVVLSISDLDVCLMHAEGTQDARQLGRDSHPATHETHDTNR